MGAMHLYLICNPIWTHNGAEEIMNQVTEKRTLLALESKRYG